MEHDARPITDEELGAILAQAEAEKAAEDAGQRIEVVVITRRWIDRSAYVIEVDTDDTVNSDALTTIVTRAFHQVNSEFIFDFDDDDDDEEDETGGLL